MDLIQVNSLGKQCFRIIPKKNTLSLEDITIMFNENMVFISIKDVKIFEANGYVYIDLPVETCIGTDFIRLLKKITDAENIFLTPK